MTSPQKKVKKKGSGTFDYSQLIPKDLDQKTRVIMEKFFRNEDVPSPERQTAIDTFLMALRREQLQNDSEGENEGNSAEVRHERPDEKAKSVEFDPNPECLSEERQRINVGWMASPADNTSPDIDRKVAAFCQSLGCQLYNFVCYPIGGAVRGFWDISSGSSPLLPPPIDLPDLQLQNHLWETYINGAISSWIDCDSENEEIAKLSQQQLLKELNYATYMGLRSMVIPLKRADNPRLAAVINEWLWTKPARMSIWVFVPTSTSSLITSENDSRDCWSVWSDFRRACSNFGCNKLIVGLRCSSELDDEFIKSDCLGRWLAEPLAAFWFDTNAFVTNPETSKAELPGPHRSLLRRLWITEKARVLVRGPDNEQVASHLRLQYSQAIRAAIMQIMTSRQVEENFLTENNIEYMDVLQVPLQPLSDNLDSGVYNTFEQDSIKYRKYREAVEACLKDLGESPSRPETLVLYVLGAGRGPLMTASLEAERHYNDHFRGRKDRLKLKVYAVEKNPNAIVTLRYVNEKAWKSRVTIVESDMRSLPSVASELQLPKPDIIVSELLGSFGDNELSPECLDGVTSFLKPTTISIPCSYTSFAAPIMSCYLHQQIRSTGRSFWTKGIPASVREEPVKLADNTFLQKYPTSVEQTALDQVYVVYLRHYCPLSGTKPVFTFIHPNFENASNTRFAEIEFDEFTMPCDIMGFAGYFHMTLYKDVTLSIEPNTLTPGMMSWFPAVIPLRQLLRVAPEDKICLVIHRKVDDKGVWYEWKVKHTTKDGTVETELQNQNGENYYMKLQ